ncbi:hypothetical protein [Endozoicomonas euniceicola]|uniref:Uncharacterized protein n=1 Tax=Endozoicomonas euniceicola TaxID=1234143 RepID=A0ABY6GSR0_9GAMM|nr:hypothetical protein [Endozoicomonas euniceicola]UYM15735.1 hypothetical protein NX720_23390 [Endozoicomonas euniceicola]
MSQLKLVRNFLCLVLLWLPTLFTRAAGSECSSSSFDQFWPSVTEVYEAEIHVGHKIDSNNFVFIPSNALAKQRKEQSLNHFENFLVEFPVFCKLKAMKDTSLNRQLFAMLIHELGSLEYALRTNKISDEYLVKMAFLNPHFTAHLIGHMRQQSDSLLTMEVTDEYLPYFHWIEIALAYKPQSESRYYKAFGDLLKLINGGTDKKELETFINSISENPQEWISSQSMNIGFGVLLGWVTLFIFLSI